ncbi:Acetylglutamate kinase [Enhygromyxa salina]|uniref:Acetylglutamate kinase n=1 Tax=Enhygromyxa salina TaxID=215803 RepID=A0A0C1ZDX9_9BACT|nr:acetylglutamate kinase [Enhygromyxa salina]KIG15859.1 Acetylglutamate kinase [Enhygromyxa salina]
MPEQTPETRVVSGAKIIAVLKFGGEVVAAKHELSTVLKEVAQLVDHGWRFVVCHGGGPQTNELSQRLGLEPNKVAGQRVTDPATLRVACQAIAGEVGCTVVAAAWGAGLRAVGISAGVVHAQRRPPVAVASEAGRIIDYGLVGDITSIELGMIHACWSAGLTPVLNAIGVGAAGGELFNINADTVAAALASELKADHLFSITSVAGVLADRHDPASRIPRLSSSEARAAIANGTINGGMIPKVEEALAALAGARAVHVLAAEPGALGEEARRPGSRGTVLTP